MKKIFFLLSMLLVSFSMNAQVVNSPVKYDGDASDTVTASATKYSDVIKVDGSYLTEYTSTIYLDELSGAARVTVVEEWANGDSRFSPCDTVVWYGSADSVITFKNKPMIGTQLRYKYTATATTQKSKFSEMFKNWYAVTPK
jgi:hypothetical protein